MKNQAMYLTDLSSRYLYKAGGFTALLFLIYSFATILILVFLKGGYPETAQECFNMLEEDKFAALLRLDIISIIVIPFYYLLFFSLYQSLKTGYELIAQIALFCTLAGVTIFISDVNLASIVIINDKYQQATTPEIKQQLLAACEGMLASDMWINTGAIIRGILIETGAVIFSILMLKTTIFNKTTGWIGLLTHGFDLSSIVIGLFYQPIKEAFIMIAGPLYIVWFVLIGVRLFRLGKENS
ncbi:hypothetical protein [Mariniphaga sediminis]|uniref:hypothetical protein n=1 Tax=Mariniphaga sediminis TaxID=1628158 RepID=UPI003561988F